jgi:queuine/archaeosine tRNA-ribosyltransferase
MKFLIDFSKKARQAILNDEFDKFYKTHYEKVQGM